MLKLAVFSVLLLCLVCGLSAAAPDIQGATAACYSPDGQTLYIGHGDGTVSIWNGQPLRRARTIRAGPQEVRDIALNASQTTLAAASESGIALVNLQSGRPVRVLKSARAPFAFESGGTLLSAIANKRGLQRWTTDGRLRATLPQVGLVLAISSDGKVVAGAKGGWEVRLWHARGGGFRLGRTIKNSGVWGGIGGVGLSPDGREVFLMGGTISKPPDGFAQTYDVATGKELHYCTAGYNIYNAAISPDRSLVVASGEWEGFGIISVCGTHSWTMDASTELGASIGLNRVVMFSPDSKTLLTGGSSQPVRLWDARDGTLKATLQ